MYKGLSYRQLRATQLDPKYSHLGAMSFMLDFFPVITNEVGGWTVLEPWQLVYLLFWSFCFGRRSHVPLLMLLLSACLSLLVSICLTFFHHTNHSSQGREKSFSSCGTISCLSPHCRFCSRLSNNHVSQLLMNSSCLRNTRHPQQFILHCSLPNTFLMACISHRLRPPLPLSTPILIVQCVSIVPRLKASSDSISLP